MRDPLFFIALLPGERLQREVTAFKQYCADHFGANHALTSPPHITLVPPFFWNISKLPELSEALDDFAAEQTPFEVKLHDFGCFSPRVIFIDIAPNRKLSALAASLEAHLERRTGLKRETDHDFNPHMTIAHRDLQSRVFPKAWAYFSKKEYRRTFKAGGLTLLRHERGRWETEESYPFP